MPFFSAGAARRRRAIGAITNFISDEVLRENFKLHLGNVHDLDFHRKNLITSPDTKHDWLSDGKVLQSANEVIDIIKQTAYPVDGKGYGRSNVYRALQLAKNGVDPNEYPLPDKPINLRSSVKKNIEGFYVQLEWDAPQNGKVDGYYV